MAARPRGRSAPASKQLEFSATLEKSELESGWHYLVIKRDVADRLGFEGKMRRVMCGINGAEPFHCALMPWGEKFFILVNKKRRDALGIAAGDKVSVTLERDESQYGLPMPPEFREVLDQDPEGDKLFHALTPGRQRSAIYWISEVKNIDRRIHTALIFIEHIKKNGGKVISKELMQELKRPIF